MLINWLHQFHLPLAFRLTEKGFCLVSYTFSILVVQRLSMILNLKTPLIIYILPKTYCHIFVTVTRHLYLAQQEGSTRIVTVFIPKIILFGSKPVDKIQVINLKAYQVDRYNFSITSSSNPKKCIDCSQGKIKWENSTFVLFLFLVLFVCPAQNLLKLSYKGFITVQLYTKH